MGGDAHSAGEDVGRDREGGEEANSRLLVQLVVVVHPENRVVHVVNVWWRVVRRRSGGLCERGVVGQFFPRLSYFTQTQKKVREEKDVMRQGRNKLSCSSRL